MFFYVSITNEQGDEEHMSKNNKVAWRPLWNEENEIFNALLNHTLELKHL